MDHVASHREQGQEWERRAWRHLRWRGWRLCARNWYGGGGELDLVCSRWTTRLIVEVRQRRSLTEAQVSIDGDKVRALRRAAWALIRQHELQRYRLRFDAMLFDGDGNLLRVRDFLGTARRRARG